MTKEMTRQEFQEIVNNLAGRVTVRHYRAKTTYGDCVELTYEWVTGGLTGGSCYDDSDNTRYYGVESETEPEFDTLDNILIEVAPQMGFLHYKKLQQFIKIDSKNEGDYYGNNTIYAIKTLKVSDIWNFLIEYDLVTEK